MVKKTVIWLAFGLVAVILLLVVGYYGIVNRPDGGKSDPVLTVDTGVNVGVMVLDLVNNSPVSGSPVFFVACCPDNFSMRDMHLSGVTGDDGWAVFTVNYTLDPDQTIYLGASNRESLLMSDFTGKAFNGSGYLGEWKSFNYGVLYNNEDNRALVSCTITVDLDTGAMI